METVVRGMTKHESSNGRDRTPDEEGMETECHRYLACPVREHVATERPTKRAWKLDSLGNLGAASLKLRDRTPDEEGMETSPQAPQMIVIAVPSRPNARRRGHGNPARCWS